MRITRKCSQYRDSSHLRRFYSQLSFPHTVIPVTKSRTPDDVSLQQWSLYSSVWRRAYGQLATNTRASSLWVHLTASSLIQHLTQRSIYRWFIRLPPVSLNSLINVVMKQWHQTTANWMSTAGPVFCIALSLLGVRAHYRALTVLFVSTGKFVN